MSKLWITWETHRRNRSICENLNIELFEIDIAAPRIKRYIYSIYKTIKKIRKSKPDTVFAQNPSMILAALCVLIKPIYSYKLVIDAHNAGIRPREGKNFLLNAIATWINRKADKVIVTNNILARYAVDTGITPYILPDPIPNIFDTKKSIMSKGKIRVLFICTWAVDEPYREVLEAAKLINSDTHIYVTGNYKKILSEHEAENTASNITLCGFVSHEDFDSLLYEADYIMDFTTRADCLVCGAYEGVAAETPLILSNTKVTRDLFCKGALYSNLSIEEISRTLERLEEDLPKLQQEISLFKIEYKKEWNNKSKNLLN